MIKPSHPLTRELSHRESLCNISSFIRRGGFYIRPFLFIHYSREEQAPPLRQDGIVRRRAVACCRRKSKSNTAGVNPRPTTYHIILSSVYGILLHIIHKSNYRNLYIFQNFRGFSTKIRQFFCENLLKFFPFYVIISHVENYKLLKGETK